MLADVEDVVQVDFGARQVGVRKEKGHVASNTSIAVFIYSILGASAGEGTGECMNVCY